MRWELALMLIVSGAISLRLMYKVALGARSKPDKVGAFILLAVPLVGPLLYWFVYNDIGPQRPSLQNRGPRGEFTHKWISISPALKAGLRSEGGAESVGEDEQPRH